MTTTRGFAVDGPGRTLALGLAVLAMMSCSGSGGPTPASDPPRGIVLIVIDTLRADRLGSHGGPAGLTPFLDELAARGTDYRNVVAPSSWTVPSIASLLTSRFPSQHATVGFDSRLPSEEITFVERLQQAGIATGGVSANPRLEERFGYAQGFDHWEVLKDPRRGRSLEHRKVRGRLVSERGLAWLDGIRASQAEARYFLYLHTMEPHSPYVPPARERERVVGSVSPEEVERVNRKLLDLSDLFGDTLTSEELALLIALYDAEVAAADAELAWLFAALEQRGVLDEALVVVTADHGEDFREHGRVLHGFTLYEPAIRVPMIVFGPGVEAGRVSEAPISLVDLAPTFLQAAGLSAEPRFEGRSLRSRESEAADLLSELPEDRPTGGGVRLHAAALIRGTRKVLQGHDGSHEVFDLVADPGEGRANPPSLAGQRDPLGQALTRRLEDLRQGARQAEVEPLDPETAEAMRALGYAVDE